MQCRKVCWVGVPKITVPLDDDSMRWQNGIYNELATYDLLLQKRDSE